MDLHLLRLALSHHLGTKLTPEVASQIEFIACGGEDLSVDPATFGSAEYLGYSLQVEDMSTILASLAALHVEFVAETMPGVVAPQWDAKRLVFLQRAGRLLQFTIRQGAELVGQSRMILSTSSRTGWVVAQEETFFIRPAHRVGMLAYRLMTFGEPILVDHFGVKEIVVKSRQWVVQLMLKRLGFSLADDIPMVKHYT